VTWSGADGTDRIMAPLPAIENSVIPTAFVAETYAQMLSPHGISNGAAFKTAKGMKHYFDYTIVWSVASQFTKSYA
jgi:hypothetical protein